MVINGLLRTVTINKPGKRTMSAMNRPEPLYLHRLNSRRRRLFTMAAGFLVIVSTLLLQTGAAFAGEKEQAEKKDNATPRTAEGLLTTTEEMIEHLILQIDSQTPSNFHPRELVDISNPAPFSESIPGIRPLDGPITSDYGLRRHPIRRTTLFHAGIDISAPAGTPILATGDGIVAFAGWHGGYGQKITISHGYGFSTVYAHLSKAIVREGQRVKRGDIIALSGNTGMSTGPHLHYEVRKNGMTLNPVAYFDGSPDRKMTDRNLPEKTDNNT